MGAKGGVVNIVGQWFCGARVLRRVDNSPEGNARWSCRMACGHLTELEGIVLRAQHKLGRVLRCKACRSARVPIPAGGYPAPSTARSGDGR